MSEMYACPDCDFSLPELEPRMFSFNAPYGACSDCKGLGIKLKIDEDLIIRREEICLEDDKLIITVKKSINYLIKKEHRL